MTLEAIRSMLAWCTLINWAVLVVWFVFLRLARGWVYSIHCRWLSISEEKFDEIHYRAMVTYKIAVFVFNLAPYLALRIIG